MKKLRKILISIVLVVALTSSVFSGVLASADTETTYSTVAHHHFDNLGGNIPENVYGSCVYVAMSMLLSFYDSYWNDSFVPEDYESTTKPVINYITHYPSFSPRLKLENNDWSAQGLYINALYSGCDDSTLNYHRREAYRDFILGNSNKYLKLHLMSIGIQLGYHNDPQENYGITLEEAANILDEYFDEIFGENNYYSLLFDNSDAPIQITVIKETSLLYDRDDVMQEIESKLTNKSPVIYGGARQQNASDDGKKGHAMVAYHIEEDGDVLMHRGYADSDVYITSTNDTEYNLDIGVLSLTFNESFAHSCSDNYILNPGNISICSCEVFNIHSEHTCVKKDANVVSYDSTGHYYECICGNPVHELHNYTAFTSVDLRHHTAVCADCGYSTLDAHAWQKISLNTSMCAYCGQTKDNLGGKPGMVPLDNENEEEIE